MICKRYTRRREIYLQRNDKRKGLAKCERDLWAEGSVAAELFVSEFFCIQADCKQHSIRSV